MPKTRSDNDSQTELLTGEEVREPRRYKVLLHNDDYTTMDFVVEVLVRIFRKSESEATIIMLAVHNEGVGLCGIYPFEVAETKVETVRAMAKNAGYPLRCSMEKE
ncbi:MAG: ATP-dependent Clp protease adaptor ClpS [Desulfovibrionaceae bacterium]|jgi:ATP-dependent Clp protease adaptor protein ClpS